MVWNWPQDLYSLMLACLGYVKIACLVPLVCARMTEALLKKWKYMQLRGMILETKCFKSF
ncbi:hypothetical protein GMO_03090 [Gluconobacter morbifer G707]|uniref:Uncharacterized protein n=1 Tax=Gluconobacter morbifer G707 TaxID=1088869 RepID=G6XFP4_9PROT|nr:hypothetical protein GMO_03090 [Gluconobacter morbifer G707]